MKPPWGRITAIDLNKGEIVWQVAHGETPDTVKNHPLLKGVEHSAHRPARRRRRQFRRHRHADDEDAGDLRARAASFTAPNGQRGAMLRAYDKATGKEVGAVYMPGAQTGSPMTYMLNGKQYIVVAVSGAVVPGEIIAFTLPGK